MVFLTRRIRLRRHLVHHGRVLVLVAVLSISSVLLSVRVSDFVLFYILGFLASGPVGVDFLHFTHIVGIDVLLLVFLVPVGEYFFYNLPNFVVNLDCFLRCNFRRCLALVFNF